MKHLKLFERYQRKLNFSKFDKHLDSILDKINKYGMTSLSKIDKEFLDAYKDNDEVKMRNI